MAVVFVSAGVPLAGWAQDAVIRIESKRDAEAAEAAARWAGQLGDVVTFPLPRGWTAKQAAGRIHSDIEHGFVRAQVVGIDDLIELKSFHAAREKALLRTEGKEYVVQDGDVINFMHTG